MYIQNLVWSALISDPIKSISAIAATISAFAATGALIIGWKNFRKDTTRISLAVKRANNGPLILQHPREEFLIFEIYNQGISPVVINQVGIKVCKKLWIKNKFINLVDLPYAYLDMRNQEGAIGTIECVGVPGTIPARSMGVFLLNYSSMRNASVNYQKQSISLDSLEFVGSQRVIRTFQEFQKSQDSQGIQLQITPYVLTGSGEYFIGKKALIRLGNLSEAIA
ncbi:hypothetical protein FACHB389_18205 [Nostoc calcicola FACHB-389]|nr:hypothetical protein [Nostoc calcicola FACHB-3891]OKH33427.1 hypothetical protein FACHB389_18205 [Nostoc calcicola FACHB-389]